MQSSTLLCEYQAMKSWQEQCALDTMLAEAEGELCHLRWQVERSQIDALHAVQQSSKVCRFCTVQQAFKRPRKTSHGCDNMQVHVMASRRREVSVKALVVTTLGTVYSSSCLCTWLQNCIRKVLMVVHSRSISQPLNDKNMLNPKQWAPGQGICDSRAL